MKNLQKMARDSNISLREFKYIATTDLLALAKKVWDDKKGNKINNCRASGHKVSACPVGNRKYNRKR